MQRSPRFTDVESERLRDAAVEVITKRCSEDAGYLRAFIRDYLGVVEAAFPPVFERCQQDHFYLMGIVRDQVLRLREQAVLDLLQQSPDSRPLPERLGFDPRRALAYSEATRHLNPRQTVVLLAAVCVSVFMLMFPPWMEERWRTQNDSSGRAFRENLLESRYAGHGFWGSRQSRTDSSPEGKPLPVVADLINAVTQMGGAPLFKEDKIRYGQDTVYRVGFGFLLTQVLVVWGGVVILLAVLRNKKHSYRECLRQYGASRFEVQPVGNAELHTVAGRPQEDRIRAEPGAPVDRPRD
jgi:hypothetical protein